MGKQILQYQIEKLVGEGVTGAVYKAVDVTSGSYVFIRQIHPYLVHSTPVKQNLEQQFDTLASLQHPGIPKMHTYVLQEEELYLISEYVEGKRLSELISSKDESISEDRAWNIYAQILDAFSYAHNKNVFHHSISPDHIVITANDKVKILGFGLANLFTDTESGVLSPEINLGNVHYQSPEQVYGKPDHAKSDIYSLGVILFELVTRQKLYPAVLSPYEVQTKIVKDTLPLIKLYTHHFGSSYQMQNIIDKATAKNSAYRFEHCELMQEQLREEKDEREALLLSKMMQQVAGNSQEDIQVEELSTVELARKKIYWKLVAQAFLLIAFLATAMIFTGTFMKISDKTDSAVIEESASNSESTVAQKNTASPVQSEKDSIEKPKIAVNKNYLPPETTKQAAPQVVAEETEIASASMAVLPEGRTRIFTANDLQTRLTHFYEALQSKDINQIEGYYASTLTRFFNEYGVEEEKLKELLERSWDHTPEDRYDILWDTFRYYRDEKGNYIMDFYMNYHYRLEERTAWKVRRVNTMIKMDKDLRIYYMDVE